MPLQVNLIVTLISQ